MLPGTGTPPLTLMAEKAGQGFQAGTVGWGGEETLLEESVPVLRHVVTLMATVSHWAGLNSRGHTLVFEALAWWLADRSVRINS